MQRAKGFMSDELFEKCIDEIARENPDSEVWLADHGESLMLGKRLVDKIHYAKSKGLKRVYLNTNGMLLSPIMTRGLLESGLDQIVFGLDAISEETYSQIRVGGDFKHVMSNISGLLKQISSNGDQGPKVWVQFIEMEQNEHEREAFEEYWGKKDVAIKIRRKLSWGGYVSTPDVELLEAERIPCPWIVNLMHILWDGRVCRCSGDHECRYEMGDVNGSTIAEIWRGPLRRERQIHLAYAFDDLNQQCKACLDWKVGAAEKKA
jgi:hypothetical protein